MWHVNDIGHLPDNAEKAVQNSHEKVVKMYMIENKFLRSVAMVVKSHENGSYTTCPIL